MMDRKAKIDEAMECVFSIDGSGRKPLTKQQRRTATARLKELKKQLGIRRMREVVELNAAGTRIVRYI
jgi:hypothetical protein